MSTEENKELVRRGFQALNERNWTTFDALCAPDFVLHNGSMTIQGYEPYKQFLSMYFAAFPDMHLGIEDIIAEGDRVVARLTFHGTHQAELMGIAATGKQISATGMGIFRLANGKAVEQWANSDDLGLLQQLGVVPAPRQAS